MKKNEVPRYWQLEKEQNETQTKYQDLMMSIPNVLHDSVPAGRSENENVVIREYGGRNAKTIVTPRDHIDIATSLDLIDLERAEKISGARFYFLKNQS